MGKRLWITWENQRRNKSLSKALGAQLVELEHHGNKGLRYLILSFKTMRLIIREKPDCLIVQNPSIVLALLAGIIGKLLHLYTVIDAHNAGIFPLEGRSRFLNILARNINSLADMVIVSNENLQKHLKKDGIYAVAVPDPIPTLQPRQEHEIHHDRFAVVFICTWSADEPYKEVIKAAEHLDESFIVYVTGNVKRARRDILNNLPNNIKLTGYLSEEDYESLLGSCDVAMALTTRDDCLLCGAYEGVAAGKPLILSDKPALKDYFNSGAVFTENKSAMIANSIIECREKYGMLSREIALFKENNVKRMQGLVQDVDAILLNKKRRHLET